jgi:hypothetical protein
VLTILIAAAVALAPLGPAMAGLHAAQPDGAKAMDARAPQEHGSHHGAYHDHDMSAMDAAGMPQGHAAKCDGESSKGCCCGDDKASCSQTCAQHCSAQAAVMPSDRLAQARVPDGFQALPTEPPPDWFLAPQPPPPRA